ncbi:MAG: alanine racemase [Clostridia bacterium]
MNSNFKNIIIDGIYTHLSSADDDDVYTLKQLSIFDNLIHLLLDNNYTFNYIHVLNSSGTLNYSKYQYNAIRIGDILYGYYPNKNLRNKINLIPSVKLVAPVVNLKEVNSNCAISYSKTYITTKKTKIATIQIGYADGLDRALSNKLNLTFNNIDCKIIGNICMDMCMIDVTNIKNIQIGNYVTILDYDDSIYNISDILHTINYEILSRISKRVKRIYI